MSTNTPAQPADRAPLGPVNGALRFLLELVALFGVVRGGPALVAGAAGWAIGLAAGLAAATAWGRFRVDGDPGPAPVAIPGTARLVLELVVWIVGGLGLAVAFDSVVPAAYGVTVVVHHLAAVPRLRWLLAR